MTPRDITVSVTARLQPAHSESNINFIFAEIHGKIVKRGYDTVDALSELCSPVLKGGNSVFIAVIACGLLPQTEYQPLK